MLTIQAFKIPPQSRQPECCEIKVKRSSQTFNRIGTGKICLFINRMKTKYTLLASFLEPNPTVFHRVQQLPMVLQADCIQACFQMLFQFFLHQKSVKEYSFAPVYNFIYEKELPFLGTNQMW